MKSLFSILSAAFILLAFMTTDWMALICFILFGACFIYRLHLWHREKHEIEKWKADVNDVFHLTEYYED